MDQELYLELRDTQWPLEYTDHDRQIARAVVYDDEGFFYFVKGERDDEFGRAVWIETPGGGVEEGEEPASAVLREVKEELGVRAEIICGIGTVSDYYNLIHRHNINHYYLCRAVSFGRKELTQDERCRFRLSTLRLTLEDAMQQYRDRADTCIGRLIADRELPVLQRAKEILDNM